MNPRAIAFVFPGIAVMLSLCGCNDSGPRLVRVHGQVTYGGRAVSKGIVTFQPVAIAEAVRPATAMIQADGHYDAVAYPSRVGMLPGKYDISVLAYDGTFLEGNVKYLVPKRYSEPATSGLHVTVAVDGPDEVLHNLTLE